MRDPARIPPLLALLDAYWRENPDLRLGQIVNNAMSACSTTKESFAVEDGVLVAYLTWRDPAVELPKAWVDVAVEDDEGNRWFGHRCGDGRWQEYGRDGRVGANPVRWRYAS